MKKFHDKWKHDKYEEEYPRAQQREKPRNEEDVKFSKDDSHGYREVYSEDENKSWTYSKPHSYQMERRTRTSPEVFVVKTPRNPAFPKHDLKKSSCHMNSANELQDLSEASSDLIESDYREHYKNLHLGIHPSHPNKDEHLKHRAFKDLSKSFDTKMKSEKELKSFNETESFRIRKDSDEITSNNFFEENSSTSAVVRNAYFSDGSNLKERKPPPYESNQLSQYYNKQNNDQSNVYFHDLSEDVYNHEEKETFQNDNMHICSQRTFINNYDSYEKNGFCLLKLTDLIHYNINLMQGQKLFEFAAAVKAKILEKIDKFPEPFKEQLEFLCEITDGDHSEKNQLLITERTCHIVKNVIDTVPYFSNIIDTPLPSLLVCQTVPNFHIITNNYCSDYESPALKFVQTSEMLSTSTTDYNLVADYNIAQNAKSVISKGISNSVEVMNSNTYRENCEVENCNTNNVKNNSSFESSLNTEEDEDIAEEPSKYYPLLGNFGKNPSDFTFSFDKNKSIFLSLSLADLLRYDVNAMKGKMVFDYGFSVKKRILEDIDLFEDPYKEKLKFLCELTDGTQRVENQILINERMFELVNDYKEELSKKDKKCFLSNTSVPQYQRMSGYRQNIPDRVPRNIHPQRSHKDEMVEDRKNFSDEKSIPRYTKKSHYEEEVCEYKKYSDGQSKNVHLRRSHYEEEMVQNIPGRQSRNVSHQSQSHYEDEKIWDSRQNFAHRKLRNAQSRSYYEGEKECDSRKNFLDRQSRNAHQSRSHYEDEKIGDPKKKLSRQRAK